MAAPVLPETVQDCTGNVYEVSKKLGKGGFAVCYRARDKGALIALKVVKTDGMPDKVADKFRTELQIHSKVRQRNIVGFFKAFSQAENTYITLELCSNGSLKEMIYYRGCLSLPEIRRFGMQLCGALHYLHLRSVMHRDIKAANIFLDSNMSVKLGDFGLAGILVTDEELGEVQRRVTVCGTPNYIAPEVLSKKKGHTTKADIWSLGVLFFHMMTGQMPFSTPEDKNNVAVFNRVAAATFTWPEKNENQLSADARSLVLALLNKEDNARPSAVEVAQLPFFKLNGIPAKLDSSCIKEPPVWLKMRHPKEMRAQSPKVPHEDMLKQCGLVPFSSSELPAAMYYSLCEEAANNEGPKLPLKGIYERRENMVKRVQPGMIRKMASKLESKPKRPIGGTKVPQPVPVEPAILLGPSQGTELPNKGPDAIQQVRTLRQALKGEPIQRGTLGDFPPTIIYSLDQSKWGTAFVLSDGSIGILTSRREPAKMVVVKGALPHFLPKVEAKETTGTEPKESKDTNSRRLLSKPSSTLASKSAKDLLLPKPLLTTTIPPESTSGPVPRDLTCFFYERRQHPSPSYSSYPPNPPPHPSSHQQPILVHAESSNTYQTPAPHSRGKKLFSATEDPHHNERCRLLTLWAKFATYMAPRVPLNLLSPTVLLGGPGGVSGGSGSGRCFEYAPEPRLVGAQVLGNVRAWAWSNGGVQWDFPDGCKVCVDGGGARVRFFHWPAGAAFSSHAAAAAAPSPPQSPPPSSAAQAQGSGPSNQPRPPPPRPERAAPLQPTPVDPAACHANALRNLTLDLDALLGLVPGDNDGLAAPVAARVQANALRSKLAFVVDALVGWAQAGNGKANGNNAGGGGGGVPQKIVYTLGPEEEGMRERWAGGKGRDRDREGSVRSGKSGRSGNGSEEGDGEAEAEGEREREKEGMKWEVVGL